MEVTPDHVSKLLVRQIIAQLGDNPDRDGVKETPERVVRAWDELYAGYRQDPRDHLKDRFPIDQRRMVTLNGIEFFSTCERHLLPFFGTADIALFPDAELCGLNKLVQVVHGYSRRLQTQETLTEQVALAIKDELKPMGVAVRLRATHTIMKSRGARETEVTFALLGCFEKPDVEDAWLRKLPS